uniref:Uncharacterized protein n=1 Tax=Plectus sambesii TaxID=2011161 RepID=A0A914W8X6_9BILA
MIESPTGRFGVLGRLSSFPVFSMRSGSATLISTCFILLVTFSFANAEAPPVHVQTQHDNCSDPNNHIAEETKETVKCMELSTYIVDRGFVPDMTVDFYQKHTNESNRFKIALFWEERSDLKQLDCPVIRYSCCSGWEDALCDRRKKQISTLLNDLLDHAYFTETCDDCCLRKGLKCSMSGTCVCPPGSSGPCCDNDEQQSEHAAVNQTQAVFFGKCTRISVV